MEYSEPMASIPQKLGFTLLVTTGLLGVVELSLRAIQPDLEAVISPLLYQRNSGQAFTSGKSPDSRVYVSGRRRTVRHKKAGVRVLVFGASAAYGEMFSPLTAFPGVAEASLRQANPEVPIEVLNLAHGGMGSRQVGEMAFRALENDNPDLIVIYTGNNEYHEIRALKARSESYDPAAELMRRRLSRSYLYRQLRETFVPAETNTVPTAGTDWLPIGRMDVTVDENDRNLGLALYEDHLRSIIVAAREHGVPLLLSTVATNIRDHVDNGTPGVATAAEQAALQALDGMVERIPSARFAAEAGQRSEAIQTEGGWQRLGKLYLRADLPEVAADAFARKELAALRPMTSNRDMRAVVRRLAEQFQTPVCDLSAALAAASTDGIPGNAEFIDHCHPNAKGHAILGRTLAACILDQGIGGLKHGPTKLPETTDGFRLDHYAGHRRIPGFSTNPVQADTTTAEGLAITGHQAFVAERFSAAKGHYTAAIELGGPEGPLRYNLGLVFLYSGDLEAAQTAFDAAAAAGIKAAARARLVLKH
jgi:hypothetical protein